MTMSQYCVGLHYETLLGGEFRLCYQCNPAITYKEPQHLQKSPMVQLDTTLATSHLHLFWPILKSVVCSQRREMLLSHLILMTGVPWGTCIQKSRNFLRILTIPNSLVLCSSPITLLGIARNLSKVLDFYYCHYYLVEKQDSDHYTFLGNCPPTPPLHQHFALSEK